MEVVIFCGGFGTRLREETEFRPKPMVEIGDRPILWHIMKIFAHFQHTDFVLALGYKGTLIKEYFYNYELLDSDFTIELGKASAIEFHRPSYELGWRVTLADTGRNTLKAARLLRVASYVKGDTFLATYGDGVSNVDLHALCAFHAKHGKLATVTGISPASMFGELITSGDRVVDFREKPSNADSFINGGFIAFDRRVFDYLADDGVCDLESHTLRRLAQEGELMVYRHEGFWACMDTQRDVDLLNDMWHRGEAPWKVW